MLSIKMLYVVEEAQKAEFARITVITCFQKLDMLNSIKAVQMPRNQD